MRKIARAAAVLAFATAGVLLNSSPAAAVDAPWCESGASRFVCTTATPAASWTIHYSWGNTTVTVPGTSSYVTGNCRGGTQVSVYYNYYSGGALLASPTFQFLCNAGPWP